MYLSMHAGAAQCLTASSVSLSEDKQHENHEFMNCYELLMMNISC